METKGKSGTVQLSQTRFGHVIDGKLLKYRVLPDNMPLVSAVRTGKDKKFLGVNDGKLLKLQHFWG